MAGYAGQLIGWVQQICGWVLEIVKRSDDVTGFVVLPKRWIVERTFGWFGWYRRLSKDYEVPQEHVMTWNGNAPPRRTRAQSLTPFVRSDRTTSSECRETQRHRPQDRISTVIRIQATTNTNAVIVTFYAASSRVPQRVIPCRYVLSS